LAKKLSFARNRLMECYFWALGMVPDEHELSNCRKGLTKVAAFVTIIDDIYDFYGSLDELQLFTEAVERFILQFETHFLNYIIKIFFPFFLLNSIYKL